MIDSVLKGTGNSRFLKSAVPAGTSWADALAMLQAGTFPIDFNGINAEGFQQVGTPLNKANLLKDATAAQIGLPPSTTPDGMFQALGNTGELHVWRKTTVSVEAGYNLGNTQKNYLASASISGDSNTTVTFKVSESVSVSVDGKVSQNNPTNDGPWGFVDGNTGIQNAIRGKFISISTKSGPGYATVSQDDIWFIPITANISFINNGTSLGYPYKYCYIADKMQKVSGFPAGTTTTYPVSTNPNAYQEGDDAKPAGYVLGDVVTGNFELAYSANNPRQFNVAESVTVDKAGNITLNSPVVYSFYTNSTGNSRDLIKGKFVTRTNNSPPWVKDGAIYYIPTDAVISYVNTWYEIDRYQPVTGYAAIPAGTTIEYLGKLGDKARVQVVSYVGTGTYGSGHPNSLTFDFAPKMVIISSAPVNNSYVYIAIMVPDAGIYSVVISTVFEYESRTPGGSGTVTKNNKTITFHSGSENIQLNRSGIKYTAVAIG